VCHTVILSLTHAQRVESLRRPEVAVTAEVSKFSFVPHQILIWHLIMPLWAGVHVWQGVEVTIILLFSLLYVCHCVRLQLICAQALLSNLSLVCEYSFSL
jgi:hypothetical protein